MNIYLKYFILCLVIIFLDIAWISLNYKNYSKAILKVQKSAINLRYEHAIITYIIILFSIIYVAIPFTLQNIKNGDNNSIENKLLKSFMYGGAVGFSIFGIYNFTSLSIYKDTDVLTGIIDTVWGTTLYTLSTFVYLLLS
jgi:uncharacterized membrane protein|uniref:DUF2177 family protein n=1 Tax=viral metagenome TaxID=1070528 RepID=A0A6C0LZ06_9ZZZZ